MATKKPIRRKNNPKKVSTKKSVPTKRASVNHKESIKKSSVLADAKTSGNDAVMQLLYSICAAMITYVLASWAIDSGSLWLYLVSFIGMYLVVSFFTSFIRLQFINK